MAVTPVICAAPIDTLLGEKFGAKRVWQHWSSSPGCCW